MASADIIPSSSVDHLIARQLPDWLTSAEANLVAGYHQALRAQQQAADSLQHVLGRIPDIETFAAPLLQQALSAAGLTGIDSRRAQVIISDKIRLPSAAEKLYQPTVTFSSRQTLLAAALHNFELDEAQASLFRTAHLVDQAGQRLLMTFEQFVGLCRELDVGGRYQALLRSVLQPKSGRGQPEQQARAAMAKLFEDGLRTRLRADLYESRLKGKLDAMDLQRLLTLVEEPPLGGSARGTLTPRQLYLLGSCINGVITLEWWPTNAEELDEVILWIPGHPQQCLHFYDTWDALYDDLARRLKQLRFRVFFSGFIKAQDRTQFDSSLARLRNASKRGERMELDGRNLPVAGDVFAHTQTLLVAKLFSDAAFVAVPTDVEDRLSRHKRLQAMLATGLDVLGLAALVVPGLGELMLVVSAAQLLDELYEGYQDWKLGDRQGALDHLFSVTEGLLVAGATAGALHTLRRVPFVDALAPKVMANGSLRLGRNACYPPSEASPLVLLEGLEGDHLSGISSSEAQNLLDVTGYEPGHLRQLHLERAQAPARLLDLRERMVLHEVSPTLRGSAFEEALQASRQGISADQAKLVEAFPGLSPRSAQEVIDSSSSAQLDMLRAQGRVPLAMAERARWLVRDSRIDRACLGIRFQGLANADSEQLILKLIEHKAPWPASSRIELRVGQRDGLLLHASQGEADGQVRLIIRHEHGYALAGVQEGGPASTHQSLLQVLLQCLDGEQKTKLGDTLLSMKQLRTALLKAAAEDREQAAGFIGLPSAGSSIRPPRRFADGRLGYPLSGGGESSQQAIRQAIHQIFPTLSELQLDAYLDAVRQRGDNLWNHYLMLQRQLAELREVLRQWQSSSQSPFDAIRRRRVANTLRRSWRRKLVDGNDEYELTIDGEHVSQLPNLPVGLDYVHVRRLTLRNSCKALMALFLAGFRTWWTWTSAVIAWPRFRKASKG